MYRYIYTLTAEIKAMPVGNYMPLKKHPSYDESPIYI